jgi:proline dehydrogenase
MSVAGSIRVLPHRAVRGLFIGLSHRRSIGRAAVRSPVARSVVSRFVAGETLEAALPALEALRQAGLRTSVDVLGESVTSSDLAAAAADRYVATLPVLAKRGLDVNVSLKLTQMGLEIDPEVCRGNVMRILDAARKVDGFVRFDMEDHTRTDATLDIWQEAHEAYPRTGVVIQSALRRSEADVERVLAAGGNVRLCKGAYDEPGSVAFQEKREVDASYARLMQRLLASGTYQALATHDARLIARARAFAEREGIGSDRFEFQMLYGVRRDLQRMLVDRGYTVRVYVPFGREWYPYFMRRLAERPANVGFMLKAIVKEEGRRLRRH